MGREGGDHQWATVVVALKARMNLRDRGHNRRHGAGLGEAVGVGPRSCEHALHHTDNEAGSHETLNELGCECAKRQRACRMVSNVLHGLEEHRQQEGGCPSGHKVGEGEGAER